MDDTVGPNRKSLLYLVSRALERVHKTPLLGMEKAFASKEPIEELWNKDASILEDVKEWRKFYATTAQGTLTILKDKQVNTGTRLIESSHGCFDNSLIHIQDAIERILVGGLIAPLSSLDY
ncbi:hypothetical protein [Methylomicrobium lacus]|uniref:hypothetical protein n=1 Tax=Methylomicrobium lacus TaxID=136992 RepID=UPI0035A8BA04